MAEYINLIENAFTDEFCQKAISFFENNSNKALLSEYSSGENTSAKSLYVDSNLTLDLKSKEIFYELTAQLTKITKELVIPSIYPINNPVFERIQIRKMLNATKQHSDNVDPIYASTSISYRVCTLICTLSETLDEIVFPKQNFKTKLPKGSLLYFPPYWMYEHYTLSYSKTRYSLTTWLRESTAIKEEETLQL